MDKKALKIAFVEGYDRGYKECYRDVVPEIGLYFKKDVEDHYKDWLRIRDRDYTITEGDC